jgi:hypothetical protein
MIGPEWESITGWQQCAAMQADFGRNRRFDENSFPLYLEMWTNPGILLQGLPEYPRATEVSGSPFNQNGMRTEIESLQINAANEKRGSWFRLYGDNRVMKVRYTLLGENRDLNRS